MDSKNEVQSITEAFSMQPAALYVGMTINSSVVERIVEEDVYIVGDPYPYYVGYASDGKRLFEFKKGTVNVIFK